MNKYDFDLLDFLSDLDIKLHKANTEDIILEFSNYFIDEFFAYERNYEITSKMVNLVNNLILQSSDMNIEPSDNLYVSGIPIATSNIAVQSAVSNSGGISELFKVLENKMRSIGFDSVLVYTNKQLSADMPTLLSNMLLLEES